MSKNYYGILGGTFDPIHFGHLIAAQAAVEALNLDRVVFLPSAHPPHKDIPSVTPYPDRKQMVTLATKDNPKFMVSGLEAERSDLSYTVRTIKDLRREFPDTDYRLILLIGADNLHDFENWMEPDKIIDQIEITVLARPGFQQSDAPEIIREKANWVQIPLIEISSTDIRNRVARNLPIQYQVPNDVADYINQKKLYLPNPKEY
jgi:nicotinate-nucleotide adenylyltransferase